LALSVTVLRNTAIYNLKLPIEKCGITAADVDMVTIIDSLYKVATAGPYPMIPSPTPYNIPFNHNTAQLAYHSALWLFKVI